MTPPFRAIDAVLTVDRELLTLTITDEHQKATFATSIALMLGMAYTLRRTAELHGRAGRDVRIKFPGNQILTLPPAHATALAIYVIDAIDDMDVPTMYEQLMNPAGN